MPSYLWPLPLIWGFFRTLLGSALLMLELSSSVEGVPGHSDSIPGFSRLFFQLGYSLAHISQYTRCSWRRQSLMVTFASWDVFWGGSGFSGCGGNRMWSGWLVLHTEDKVNQDWGASPLGTFGLTCLKGSFVCWGSALNSVFLTLD